MIIKKVKGDTINLELQYVDSDGCPVDITDYKIRCEIYDISNSIKLATVNSGGQLNQITVTDAINGKFTIKVEKGLTKCFKNKANIEVEVETTDNENYTILPGEDNEIRFIKQKISWNTPQ
jgi:phage-related protein